MEKPMGFPCLGKYIKHSCYAWAWDRNKRLYFRECAMMGCSFLETSKDLILVGQVLVVGGNEGHKHKWTQWRSAADPFGMYRPPWQYRRECHGCKMEQKVEDLVKGE